MAEITWCSLSLRGMERQMALRGFRCGKDAIARMMREDGYSLQGMSRVLEGKQHPDRDAQFRHINAVIAEYLAAGLPAVSVDTKKKELIGPGPGRAGRGGPQGTRCGSATTTSPMRSWGRSRRTGCMTLPRTGGSRRSGPATTPARSR